MAAGKGGCRNLRPSDAFGAMSRESSRRDGRSAPVTGDPGPARSATTSAGERERQSWKRRLGSLGVLPILRSLRRSANGYVARCCERSGSVTVVLAVLQRSLIAIAEYAFDLPTKAQLQRACSDFASAPPGLKDVRDSIAHIEERVRTEARGRKITTQPTDRFTALSPKQPPGSLTSTANAVMNHSSMAWRQHRKVAFAHGHRGGTCRSRRDVARA